MRLAARAAFTSALAAITIAGLMLQSGYSIRAQSGVMRWDGLLEGISVTSSLYGWGNGEAANGPNRMSRHAISADGRYVLFESMAQNIGAYYDWWLFLRDRMTGETRTLTAGVIHDPVLSADGNNVAFSTCEPYWRPDQLPICDIFALNPHTWTFRRLTELADGTLSDGDSAEPVLSSTGRFVVFRTSATNLFPIGAGQDQIALLDRDADGNGIFDDPGTAHFEAISVTSAGFAGNGPSSTAEVSEDGRFVAFRSGASDLVSGDTNGVWDVFLRDRQSGITRRINVRPEGQESFFPVNAPAISMTPDGRFIAYSSADGMLAAGYPDDANNMEDVFVYDALTEWTTRLDVGWGPPVAAGYVPGNGPTRWPMFSADGRYVSLETDATNLEVPSAFPVRQVLVYDRETRKPTRVSIKPDLTDPNGQAARPQISADGSTVLFVSPSSNLMPAVPLGADEIYAAVHLEVTPEEVTVPGRGGQGTFSIAAQQYTRWWTAWDWSQYWFGAFGPPVGMGNGSITMAAFEANLNPQPRSIDVVINDVQTVVFTQEAGLSLASVSPNSGPMTGGTSVTLRGTGFEPDTRVIFEGYDALSTQFVDSTTLIATSPAHVPGTIWMGVFSSDYRSAWLDQAFTYVDTTPPTVTPVIYSGTLGNNGWYTSDVWFYFYYDDPDSSITSTVGCNPGPLTTDTNGTTFTCTATSGGGSTTASITIKRDATPPGGIISTPINEFLYKRFIYYQTSYVCGDSMSGIASCTGPAPSGQPLATSVPGPHTFMVQAEDRAGNVGFIIKNYDVGSAVCAPRPEGLIGWWPGDGHTRDIIARNDGTFVNGSPNYYSSPYSMSFAFTSSAYMRVPEAEALRLSNAFTLSAWVYQVRDWLNPVSVIAGREGEYLLARGPNGNIHYSIANTDPGWGWVDTGIWMDRERWTKIALTYDGTVISLYKNGRLLYARPASGAIGDTAPAENEFRVAARQKPGEPSYFDGSVDDLELVNRAMTPAEIEAAYYSADLGICLLPTTLSFTPNPQRAPYGGPAEIVARLTDSQSQPLSGEQVHFTFRNVFAGTAVTDSTGTARMPVSIAGLSAATYANAVQAAHPATAYLQYSNANSDFVIDRATPTITWNAPAPITYGTALGSQQLNASASVGGSFAYSPVAGSILAAGSQTLGVTFTPFSSNYSSVTANVPLTVLKATPTITVNGGSFTYDGNAHAATGTVTGIGGVNLGTLTFTYDGSPNPPVNAGSYAVVGSYAGSANYNAGSQTATLTIGKATPVVAVNGGMFTYDGASHPATGSVSGVNGAQLGPLTFTYNGATDEPVTPGTYSVVGSYAGDTNYAVASGTATIVIDKATPTVTAAGGTFTYDGSTHVATGTVTGIGDEDLGPLTFTYDGGSELPRNAGTYAVVAAFAGNANYAPASGNATITIGKATATVTVNGGNFTYDGLAHRATGNVMGIPGEAPGPLTFTYNGASEPPVGAGPYDVIASFAGTSNYLAASGTGTIVIGKAASTVTVNGGSFTYDGASHAATGSATGIGGVSLGPLTFTYNGSANAPVNAGTYDAIGVFVGDANYMGGSGSATITIGQATAVLSWPQPGAIVYGTPLGAAQLIASANVAGTFVYSPAAGVVLGAGSGRPLSATFVPDSVNYAGGSVATTINVVAAPLIVRANEAAKVFGAPLPPFGVTFTGFVNGDTPASLGGVLTLGTTANAGSPVGAYPIVPGGLTSLNYAIGFVNGTLSIFRAGVAIVASSGPNPSGFEQPMTFTASVAALPPGAGVPSGSVRFFDGVTLLGTSVLASGSATLNTAGLDVGSRSITAQYDGDASFTLGAATATHVVNSAAATPTVSLSSSRNPASAGQSLTLTATVSMSSGPVSGLVEFYDGGTLIGSASIASGHASLTTFWQIAGSKPVTALYVGSVSAPPARSNVLVQAVSGAAWKNRSTTLGLVASPNPSTLGTTVVLTATVDGSTSTVPSGRVLFMIDGLVVGNPLGESLTPISGSDSRATLSVPGLAHGRHKVTATYLGSSTYRGSTGAVVETIN